MFYCPQKIKPDSSKHQRLSNRKHYGNAQHDQLNLLGYKFMMHWGPTESPNLLLTCGPAQSAELLFIFSGRIAHILFFFPIFIFLLKTRTENEKSWRLAPLKFPHESWNPFQSYVYFISENIIFLTHLSNFFI